MDILSPLCVKALIDKSMKQILCFPRCLHIWGLRAQEPFSQLISKFHFGLSSIEALWKRWWEKWLCEMYSQREILNIRPCSFSEWLLVLSCSTPNLAVWDIVLPSHRKFRVQTKTQRHSFNFYWAPLEHIAYIEHLRFFYLSLFKIKTTVSTTLLLYI